GRDNMKSLRESGALSGEGGFSRPWMSDPDAVERAHWDFAPVTDAAKLWQGWGTAHKPAHEPIFLARKPLAGTVAANVLEHGTGALNIDACRVGDGSESQGQRSPQESSSSRRYADTGAVNIAATPGPRGGSESGRWPTNVVLDDTAADELDKQSGNLPGGVTVRRNMHG